MGYKSGQNIGIRLMLLRDYFNTHANKTTAVKRKELEDYLQDRGFPVERKTLYTDLELLEIYFNMDIRYDQRGRGYVYENPPFEPYEIRLLVDSVYASKFITRQKAREIAGKVKQFADPQTRRTLDRQVYVADRVRSMNESVVKDAEHIHEAIAADKQISFQYFHYSPDKSKPKSYSKKEEACQRDKTPAFRVGEITMTNITVDWKVFNDYFTLDPRTSCCYGFDIKRGLFN